MKKRILFLTTALALFTLVFTSCSKDDDNSSQILKPTSKTKTSLPVITVSDEGYSTIEHANLAPIFVETDNLEVSEMELIYADRQEAKLTFNLYKAAFKTYDNPIIESLLKTESRVIALDKTLKYYEITVPAIGELEVFTKAERQTKFNTIKAKFTSLNEVFKVMTKHEEERAEAYKKEINKVNTNLKCLLTHLMYASQNHMKLLVNKLKAAGITYTPTVMPKKDFDAIIKAEFNHGKYYNKHGKGDTNSAKRGKKTGEKAKINDQGKHTNS